MGFSRQEYWSGLPFPSPGDLSDPGIEPRSPALQADALTSEPPGTRPYLTGASQLALTSLVAQTVKCLPTMRETRVQSRVLPSPADLPNPGIEPGFPALYRLSHQGSQRHLGAPVKYVAWFYVLLCFHNLQKLSCAIDLIASQSTTWF